MENRKGVRYRKPPLIEALCEFRFQETETIPNIILGRLYEQIEEDFPTVETHRGIGVQTQKGTLAPTIVMEERTRFANKDGTKLIQIGSGLLVVNQLKPYKDYLSFRAFIEQTLETYRKVAKPKDIQRIGLRYINRIEIKADQSLEDVFNISFIIPSMFQNFPDPYLLKMEFEYSNGRDKLVVILATAPEEKDLVEGVMLDFDYALSKPDEINGNLLEWLDEAHDKIEKAFHACLKESVINTFEPEDI
jgi:uncharacterized protein (TIGR04255 family)